MPDNGDSHALSIVDQMMDSEKFKIFFKSLVKEAMDEKVENLKKRLDVTDGEIHDLRVENEQLIGVNEELQRRVDNLNECVEMHAMTVEELQQYSRRNTVLVSGVSEEKGENTDEVIKKLAAEKIKVPITDADIDRTHRIGKPKQGVPRAIVVKFTRYNVKNQIMRARRNLKGSRIGIQEMLTVYKQRLLGRAQELVKEASWVKSTWSWDGRIYVLVQPEGQEEGKKHLVKCQQDLNKIWHDHHRFHTRECKQPEWANAIKK